MPAATFERELTVRADASTVWKTLTDVELLVSWVSVLEDVVIESLLEKYQAVLADRLGPFKLRADMDIEVRDVLEPDYIEVYASGEDRQVASRITVGARLSFSPHGEGTLIKAVGTYEVAGRVATLGAATINKKAEKILQEFFGKAQEVLG